ncbi:MAG: lipopolysaccharide biosynthesis protein [Lacunisphaera sp.]
MNAPGQREHRAVRATAVFTVFNYAGMAASFISVPLLLRWLGRENYGLMLTALAFMNYLSFTGAGLNWGSIVLISEAHGRHDRAEMAKIFRHSLVLGAVSALVAGLVAVAIFAAARSGWRLPMFAGHPDADGLLLVVALQCALGLLVSPIYALFQGMQEGHWVGLYQGCARILSTAAIAAAAWFTRDPALALFAGLAAIALFAVVATVHARRTHPWLFVRGPWRDGAEYRRQLHAGAKSFGLQVARTVQGTAPVLVIGSFAGPAAVPLYSVPATLVGAVFGVFTSWNMSVQPAYGASWAVNDRDWVVRAFRRTLDLTLLLGTTAMVGFTILGPSIIALWTHGTLQPSEALCASAASVALVQAVSGAVQFCLVGINQHRSIAVIEIIHTAFALGGAALAVAWWGPAGVGPGIAVAYVGTAAWLGFRDLARRLDSAEVVPGGWWIGRVMLVGAAGILAGVLFVRLWPPAGLLAATAAAAAGAIIAAGTVVFGTVALRIRSFPEWMTWAGAISVTFRRMVGGLPQSEPMHAD